MPLPAAWTRWILPSYSPVPTLTGGRTGEESLQALRPRDHAASHRCPAGDHLGVLWQRHALLCGRRIGGPLLGLSSRRCAQRHRCALGGERRFNAAADGRSLSGHWRTASLRQPLRCVAPNSTCCIHRADTICRSIGGHSRSTRNNKYWSGRRDSNPRPSAPKADALPGCATPRHSSIVARIPLRFDLSRRAQWPRSQARYSTAPEVDAPAGNDNGHVQQYLQPGAGFGKDGFPSACRARGADSMLQSNGYMAAVVQWQNA
jgi:hypothetical protein